MDKERRIGHDIKTLNNLLYRNFVKNLKECLGEDATVMHGWILGFVVKSEPEIIYQKDVEKEFKIAKSTATSTLKLMEKKGLIVRETAAHDERLKRISVTDKGREVSLRMKEGAEHGDKVLTQGIPEDKLNIFYSVLDDIKKNATMMD